MMSKRVNNCQKLTREIGEYAGKDLKIRQLLRLDKIPFDEINIIRLGMPTMERLTQIWQEECEIAYEKWRKYKDGEVVFETENHLDSRFVYRMRDGIPIQGSRQYYWEPHPEGLLFGKPDQDNPKVFLIKDNFANYYFPEDIEHNYKIKDGAVPIDSCLVFEEEIRRTHMWDDHRKPFIPKIYPHPKGFVVKSEKSHKFFLNGEKVIGSDWQSQSLPHIAGLVRYQRGKGVILNDRLVLAPSIDGRWDLCNRGIISEKRHNLKDYLRIRLNSQEILYEGPGGMSATWKAHPEGLLLIRGKQVFLNNKLLFEYKEESFGQNIYDDERIRPYPGGVIIYQRHHVKNGKTVNYVDRWTFYDGSQYE